MKLKVYQEEAVRELIEKTVKLLGYSESKKIVFKAPTGSGKTIIIAEFLKKLVTDSGLKQELSFIWAAPRPVLTNQSKEKLENYFESSRALKCSSFEDLEDKKIDLNEILFINWESINKKDNIFIKDNEQDFNLTKIIENTKEEGREVVMRIENKNYFKGTDLFPDGIRRKEALKILEELKKTLDSPSTPVTKSLGEPFKSGKIGKCLKTGHLADNTAGDTNHKKSLGGQNATYT